MKKSTSEELVLGVDVGATKIALGLVRQNGQIQQVAQFAMHAASQSAVLESIQSALDKFLSGWDGPRPLAIGLGLVGQTDPRNGLWLQAMNLPITSTVPLADWLQSRYHLPVMLDNDVHAATLAELRWGAGRRARHFIYLNIGTGLAAGLVCDGQLVRGAANYAGELGHTVVDENGPLCTCGRRGCLETLASGGGILAQVRALLESYPASPLRKLEVEGKLTCTEVFRAAQAGDALAKQVGEGASRALAKVLTDLVNLLNPELILCGGGVVQDGWLIEHVAPLVRSEVLPAAQRALVGIFPSPLKPERVGVLGAASLAWNYFSTHARRRLT